MDKKAAGANASGSFFISVSVNNFRQQVKVQQTPAMCVD